MEDGAAGLRFLSWLWTPLVVVTAACGGQRSGQVAVTAQGASIVPERPRLTVALWKYNFTHDLTAGSGAFAVHLLRADQDALVYHFGLQSGRDLDKFDGLDHTAGVTGTPLLRDCLAAFDCRVVNQMDGGDHTIFLADVVAAHGHGEGEPLWWRDLRPRMPAEQAAIWDAKQAVRRRLAIETMDSVRRGP
jgi:flavin reductase (DIM6/NTAB) family NADH-FMN oxidoreductase RutF